MSAFTQSPLNDPQRHRVYTMEWECFGGAGRAPLQLKHARRIASVAAKSWKVPIPKIEFGPGAATTGAMWISPGRIVLIRGHSSIFHLVHELAHHIQWHITEDDYEDHGPHFVGIQMLTLDLLQLMPIALFETGCRAYGVAYVHPKTGKLHKPRGSLRARAQIARAAS